MPRVEKDTPAPAFTLPDMNGNPVSLADFQGGWVLIVLNRGFA